MKKKSKEVIKFCFLLLNAENFVFSAHCAESFIEFKVNFANHVNENLKENWMWGK